MSYNYPEARKRYADKLKALYPNQTTYNGKQCKYGHAGLRYVNGGKCVECMKGRDRSGEREKSLEWHKRNSERSKELNRRWHRENPQKAVAKVMKRRAIKLRAIPKWADLKAIETVYSACPDGFEVDHIVPLQGELVCGLHVENNLQYLTKAANASKSNKFDPMTFDHQQPELFS